MDPLCYNLTPVERGYLNQLASMPGFKILQRMLDEASDQSAREVIKLKPTDPDYLRKLQALQYTARAINSFAAALLKSIEMHCKAADLEAAMQKEENEQKVNNPFKGVLLESNQ